MIEANWLDYEADVTVENVVDLLDGDYAVRIVNGQDGQTLSAWDRGSGVRLDVDAYHARRRFAS